MQLKSEIWYLRYQYLLDIAALQDHFRISIIVHPVSLSKANYAYSTNILQASMWPSIPLVVSQATVGTAMGLTTSIQMIGIGISNLVVGKLLGNNKK